MAKLIRLTNPNSVELALDEYDELGREAFLAKYQFGRSTLYYVSARGRYYDSKAVLGCAFGKQFPAEGPLIYKDFSGGESGAVPALERLGFKVVDSRPRVLVLAENELSADASHSWQDVTGERYHFPNTYRNRITPGTPFIYYRGSRRRSGRADPEYFGSGVIGSVYQDPDTSGLPAAQSRWLAEIEDYRPFLSPLPFRAADGEYLELGVKQIRSNYWGVGVREIEPHCFNRILSLAGSRVRSEPTTAAPQTPELVEVVQIMVASAKKAEGASKAAGAVNSRRLSGRAKEIGDNAERIALEWLQSQADPEDRHKFVWHAQLGETPGYDIGDGRRAEIEAYEVKATCGQAFTSFELTSNELRAAREIGSRYHVLLVADCEGKPKFCKLSDIAGEVEKGLFRLTPILFRVERLHD